jgi:hypothetical protein
VDLLFDFLNNALFETGVFDVVQKSKRNELLKEIEFSASDTADAEKTHKIGKLLSSKLLLFGSIGKLGSNILYSLTTVDVDTGKTVSTYSKTYKKLEDIAEDLPKVAEEIAGASKRAEFQKKSQVLYYEDFQTQSWPVSERLFFKDGRYHIFSKDADWYTWELLSTDDCTIEVEAEHSGGLDNQGFGVIYRVQDTNNFYLFEITKNGYFKAEKRQEGTYSNLIEWEKSSSINPKGVNYLRVDVLGRRMTFFINRIKVKEISDSTFPAGHFGIFSSKGVNAAFDNLIVYQGRLLFYDTFSEHRKEWPEDKNIYIKDGEYIVDPPADSGGYFGWGINSYTDFAFKAETRWISGPENSNYGLAFRAQDLKNQYVFEISKNGYYMLAMYLAGKWKVLVSWKKTEAVNAEGKNLLCVECRGSTIRLYVNSTLVDTVTDTTFSRGKIGVESYEGVKAGFDDVQVFDLE